MDGPTLLQLEESLQKGQRFSSKAAFSSAVHAFFNRKDAPQTVVKRSDSKLCHHGCPDSSCKVKVNASKQKDGKWKVTKSHLLHTCASGGTKRKRSVSLKVQDAISGRAISNVAFSTVATPTLMGQIASVNNAPLLANQRFKAAKMFDHKPLVAAVGEFRLMEKFIEYMNQVDPRGMYKLEIDEHFPCGRRFESCLLVPSISNVFFRNQHRDGVFAIDATYLTGVFRGFLFTAVAKDANEQLLLLAFGWYHTENTTNWSQFVLDFRAALDPNKKVKFTFLCDNSKGLEALRPLLKEDDDGTVAMRQFLFALGDKVNFSRCTFHLIDKNAVKFLQKKGLTFREDLRAMCFALARAGTKKEYDRVLKTLKSNCTPLAQWMEDRKHEYARFSFLLRGIKRFGDDTSNAAEQFNNIIAKQDRNGLSVSTNTIKQMPIISQATALLSRISRDVCERNVQAASWMNLRSNGITPGAEARFDERTIQPGMKYTQYSLQTVSPTLLVGKVKHSQSDPIILQIELKQHMDSCGNWRCSMSCSCMIMKDQGMPCEHFVALIHLAKTDRSPEIRQIMQSHWSYSHRRWFHAAFWVESYAKQYQSTWNISQIPTFTSKDQKDVLPWPMEKVNGRKSTASKKKQKTCDSKGEKNLRRCYACGKLGHFGIKCKEPNSELITNHVLNKYAKEISEFPDNVARDAFLIGLQHRDQIDSSSLTFPMEVSISGAPTQVINEFMKHNPVFTFKMMPKRE